jgi:prepilin-type processing-associated H-X9-DG protein
MTNRIAVIALLLLATTVFFGCEKGPEGKLRGTYLNPNKTATMTVSGDKLAVSGGPMTITMDYKVVKTDGNKLTLEIAPPTGPKREMIATVADDSLVIENNFMFGGHWTREGAEGSTKSNKDQPRDTAQQTLASADAKDKERDARDLCAKNLRKIGEAMLLYSNDHRGNYPADLKELLKTQEISPAEFVCPATGTAAAPGKTRDEQVAALAEHCSYVYMPGLTTRIASECVEAYEPLSNHHDEGSHILWGDGHVSFESKAKAEGIIASLMQGKNPPNR